MTIHAQYRGVDPLWFTRKRDVATVSKYLQLASRVYYVSALLIGWFSLWATHHTWKADNTVFGLVLLFMIPPAAFFYLFSLYRVFWYLMPGTDTKRKIIKFLYGAWLIIFLIVNFLQMLFFFLTGDEIVFRILSFPVTYQYLTFGINFAVAGIGEILLKKVTALI